MSLRNFSRKISTERNYFILSMVITAALISITSFLTKSFWGDEICSYLAALSPGHEFFAMLRNDFHPPLYFFLLKIWTIGFGVSEAAARAFQFVNAVFFLYSAFILYTTLLKGQGARIAFILLSVSAEAWLFLPMLRYYAFAAGLVSLTTVMFYRWMESDTIKSSGLLLLGYICILYSNYPASIIIPVHFAFLLFFKRSKTVSYLKIIALCFLSFTPWVVTLYYQLDRISSGSFGSIADFNSSPFSVVLKFFYCCYTFFIPETVFPFEPIVLLGIIIIPVSLFLTFRNLFRQQESRILSLILFIIISGILYTSLITTFVTHHTSFIYIPPRTFFVFPFFILLITMIGIALPIKWLRICYFGYFFCLNFYAIYNLGANRNFLVPVYASPWKEMTASLTRSNAMVISDEKLTFDFYRKYLSKGLPSIDGNDSALVANSLAVLKPNIVYLIISGRESTNSDISPKVISLIENSGTLVENTKYLKIDNYYRAIKSKLTKRDSYDAKFVILAYQMNYPVMNKKL